MAWTWERFPLRHDASCRGRQGIEPLFWHQNHTFGGRTNRHQRTKPHDRTQVSSSWGFIRPSFCMEQRLRSKARTLPASKSVLLGSKSWQAYGRMELQIIHQSFLHTEYQSTASQSPTCSFLAEVPRWNLGGSGLYNRVKRAALQ